MRHFQWVPIEQGDLYINVDRIIAVEEIDGTQECIVTVDGFKNPVVSSIKAVKFVEELYDTQREDKANVPTYIAGTIGTVDEVTYT